MASSLLDELPCLLDEAEELVARLGFFLKLVFSPPPSRRAHPHSDHHNASDPFVLRQQLAGVDIDAIARSFSKHLLLVPSSASPSTTGNGNGNNAGNAALTDKLDALLPPPESAPRVALQTLVAKIFHLMKRVYQWQQTAWDDTLLPLFMDTTASSSSSSSSGRLLAFDSHRALTSLVLNGVATSVKLHLLWSSYANLSGLLVLHTFLESQKPQQPQQPLTKDEDIHRALDFVLYFGSNPLIKLQQELQCHPLASVIATSLVELVLSCFDCYVGCHDLARLKHGLFQVDGSVVQGTYASSAQFQDVVMVPQLVDWVLCVALCLPQQWKATPVRNTSWQLWDFVQLVAQERLVLVVARDVVVNVHDLLFQQLTSAIASSNSSSSSREETTTTPSTPSTPSTAATLQPLKKAFTRLSKRTVQTAGEKRRERRVFVLWFLRDSVKLVRHNGALTAPLFPRLLAVLALARDELEWLLAHGAAAAGGSSPSSKLCPTHVKSKHLERAAKSYAVDAAAFAELLRLMHELRALLERERECVRRYFLLFIARGDADAIASEIRSLESSQMTETETTASNSSQLAALLQGFADRRRFQVAPSDPGFASWRREWQQLSVHLLMAPGGSGGRSGNVSVPTAVSHLLDRACRHANYVQCFEPLVERVASFSKCFWFQDVVDQSLRELLKPAPAAQIEHAEDVGFLWIVPVVLSLFAGGHATIEELLEPSEATHELACLLHRVELEKLAIRDALQRAIDDLVAQDERLHAKLSPLLVLERMAPTRAFKNGVSSSSKTAQKAATAMLLLTPGTESRLLSVADAAMATVQPLAVSRTRLSAVVLSLDQLTGSLAVEDPVVRAMGELVKSSIHACVVRFLRALVTEPSGGAGGGGAGGGAGVESRVLALRVAWEDASRQWRALVRCLRLEFQSVCRWIDVAAIIKAARASESCSADETAFNLMARVLAFYQSMLETKCVPKTKSHHSSSSSSSSTSTTSTAALLVSLSTSSYVENPQLIDRHAVHDRTIEAAAFASPRAFQFLQEIVGRDGLLLIRSLTLQYVATHTRNLYARLEKDKIALIRLKLAFPDDQSEIHMAVRIMDALDNGIVHELQCVGNGVFFLKLLDASLADAVDKTTTTASEELRNVLYTSGLPSHVQAIWNLLPWAFVGVFYGAVWPKTTYLSTLDATSTNVHLVAIAMQFLVDMVEPRSPQEKESPDAEASSSFSSSSSEEEELQRRRERRRHVAYITSQAVLNLRRVSHELPTLAMVAVAKQLTRSLAVCSRRGSASSSAGSSHSVESAMDDWLPDLIQEMTALAA